MFTGLGVIALIEKRIFLVARFHEGLEEGVSVEIVGWIMLATGLVALVYQLRSSNHLLSSFAIYCISYPWCYISFSETSPSRKNSVCKLFSAGLRFYPSTPELTRWKNFDARPGYAIVTPGSVAG